MIDQSVLVALCAGQVIGGLLCLRIARSLRDMRDEIEGEINSVHAVLAHIRHEMPKSRAKRAKKPAISPDDTYK
jgi:hypothetical protein